MRCYMWRSQNLTYETRDQIIWQILFGRCHFLQQVMFSHSLYWLSVKTPNDFILYLCNMI